MWYNNSTASGAGQGFSTYLETYYKPAHTSWQGNVRLQFFETDGYIARIYSYEDDLPYNFSIPFYYDKGVRYYFNINWDASHWLRKKQKRKLDANLWLRWSQTIYPGKTSIGTYLDQINTNHQSEIRIECILAK